MGQTKATSQPIAGKIEPRRCWRGGYTLRQVAILDEEPDENERKLSRRRLSFRESIAGQEGALQAIAIEALFGVSRRAAASAVGHYDIKGGAARIAGSQWSVEAGEDLTEGTGLLDLAALLFDIPAGVAAVRLLEAVTAECFDAEASLELAAVVDRWAARKAVASSVHT